MNSAPSLPPVKQGPSTPMLANADMSGSLTTPGRSFSLAGVRTSSVGVPRNPALTSARPTTRRKTGGNS